MISPAAAVIAAVGVGDTGSQLLGGWLGDRIGRRNTMLLVGVGAALGANEPRHRRLRRIGPDLDSATTRRLGPSGPDADLHVATR